ncbi:hypothetical protein Dsin_008718 [Dipteronia sinensis]|uniref:Uncharacterized protein n=1 Tax=Dipteronia sinensis TaxID=43782 RepID=A0AAE0EAY4_9ROSI|nr:hypothetical protein Dsin_008718 [Dipteronia sinensis]
MLERIQKRLAFWKKRFMSKWGRLVLIKAVLSSIPTYFMAVFQIPISVAKAIEKFQRSFFWGDGIEKQKLHAIDWGTIYKSKRNGSLGVGRISDKNKGLLAKWVQRYGRKDKPLWKRVISAKYGAKVDKLNWNREAGSSASHFVKAVGGLLMDWTITAKIIKGGLRVVVGSGNKVNFWSDVWREELPLKVTFPRILR